MGGKGKLESSPVVLNITVNNKHSDHIYQYPLVFMSYIYSYIEYTVILLVWTKFLCNYQENLRFSQQFRYFFLCLLPFLPSLLTHFLVYFFLFLQMSVGLPGKWSKETLLQLPLLLSNAVLAVMALYIQDMGKRIIHQNKQAKL